MEGERRSVWGWDETPAPDKSFPFIQKDETQSLRALEDWEEGWRKQRMRRVTEGSLHPLLFTICCFLEEMGNLVVKLRDSESEPWLCHSPGVRCRISHLTFLCL